MDGRAASQTITDKIPFLINNGIKPLVISGVLGGRDAALEHYKLLPIGPSGLRFDLRHLIRRRVGSKKLYQLLVGLISIILVPLGIIERFLFGLSSQASWAVPAFLRALALIDKRNISVIYTTGGAYSAHLCGYWLKSVLGDRIQWLAELHDPLVPPGGPPQGRDEKFQKKLECLISQKANIVWWFTDGALASAVRRNPTLALKAFSLLPGASPRPFLPASTEHKTLRFGHFGSLTKNRSLCPFLVSLMSLLRENPEYRGRVELHLYGGKPDPLTEQLVDQSDLKNIVFMHGRIEKSDLTTESGRSYIHKKMAEMDCLLIPHGTSHDCTEYIPSKLYDYLWANRPIFVTSNGNLQFEHLISERGGWFINVQDSNQITAQLKFLIDLWAKGALQQRWKHIPISTEFSVAEILKRVKDERLRKV